MAKTLTDRSLRALKPAERRTRYETPSDTEVPGLRVRVDDSGNRSFILLARYPGNKRPGRREIGDYRDMSLAQAREKARAWREMLRRGIDPKQKEADERKAEQARRDAEQQEAKKTFGYLCEEYFRLHLARTRRRRASEREIRKELISRWRDLPATEVTRRHVKDMMREIAGNGKTRTAHNMWTHAASIYSWGLNEFDEWLKHSPCAGLKPSMLIGKKNVRTRTLENAELRTVWEASEKMGYPYAGLIRLLMLTGQRLNEVSGARRSEFDLEKRLWVIPPQRFKSEASQIVPLSPMAINVIESLPDFEAGDCLFSSTHGRKPVNGFSVAKKRLDEKTGPMRPWTFHDLRRTLRTELAALKIPDAVAELVIGHGPKDVLQRTYNQHKYQSEMREALEAWAGKLRDIVQPPPENVVKLARA